MMPDMKKTKRRQQAAPPKPSRVTAGGHVLTFSDAYRSQEAMPGVLVPSEDEVIAAFDGVPADLTWEWAAPRLTPLFERGDGARIPGDPNVNVVTPLGVAIGFGVEIGPTFARVTRSMLQRWEARLEQVETAAFEHLGRVAAGLTRSDVQHAVYRGHLMHALVEPGGWASSVILAGEAVLTRIFGDHAQTLAVPTRNQLVSFDATTPLGVVFDVCELQEMSDPHPLRLEPFFLQDGELRWAGRDFPGDGLG